MFSWLRVVFAGSSKYVFHITDRNEVEINSLDWHKTLRKFAPIREFRQISWKIIKNSHYITENILLRNNSYLEKDLTLALHCTLTSAQERMQHPVDRKGGSSFGSDVFAWYPFTGVAQDSTQYLKNVYRLIECDAWQFSAAGSWFLWWARQTLRVTTRWFVAFWTKTNAGSL